AEQAACSGGAGGFTFCGQAIGTVASEIVAAQQAYQAASATASSNPVYIGSVLADAIDGTGTQLFAPNYVTPRSVQMNIGIQHQIRPGTVLTVDYLRNISTHNLLTVDTNHVGAANSFNPTNAIAAIAATNSQFGCNQPGSAGVDCAINAGATIADYAGNGLDSGYSL